MVASIVSQQNPTILLTKLLGPYGCDTPERGGFSGRMNEKPSPFIIEERPKAIDPKTGKLVYVDKLRVPGAIYLLG